jgi:hypothetical protein
MAFVTKKRNTMAINKPADDDETLVQEDVEVIPKEIETFFPKTINYVDLLIFTTVTFLYILNIGLYLPFDRK